MCECWATKKVVSEWEGKKHEMLSQLSNTNTKSFLGTESLGRWCNSSYCLVILQIWQFSSSRMKIVTKFEAKPSLTNEPQAAEFFREHLFPNANQNPVFSTLLFNTSCTFCVLSDSTRQYCYLSFLRWIAKHDRRSKTWNQYSVKWAKLTVRSTHVKLSEFGFLFWPFARIRSISKRVFSLCFNTIIVDCWKQGKLEFLLSFLRVNSQWTSRECRVSSAHLCLNN